MMVGHIFTVQTSRFLPDKNMILIASSNSFKDETMTEVGQINFGGGIAERYLGDGRWETFREDERTCNLTRYGQAHPSHEYRYMYTAYDGIVSGSYWCDGLVEDTEPYPLCPIGTQQSNDRDCAAGVDPTTGRCRCDVCIRTSIYHPESTCTCRVCVYARSIVESHISNVDGKPWYHKRLKVK